MHHERPARSFSRTSCTFWKPAFSRRAAAVRTAWKGVGDALTNSRSLCAASGPCCCIMVMVRRKDCRGEERAIRPAAGSIRYATRARGPGTEPGLRREDGTAMRTCIIEDSTRGNLEIFRPLSPIGSHPSVLILPRADVHHGPELPPPWAYRGACCFQNTRTSFSVVAQAFGLVCSASSNSQYDGKLAYVPALEDVLVWDVKRGQMVRKQSMQMTTFSLLAALNVARDRAPSRGDLHTALASEGYFRSRLC